MSKTPLPDDDSLKTLQEYIQKVSVERGFNTESAAHKMVVLMEETGELAEAVRKTIGLKFDKNTDELDAGVELADVLIVLLGLASILNVDLSEEFRKKEKKNRKRTWN